MPLIASPHPAVALAGEFDPAAADYKTELAAFHAQGAALCARLGIPAIIEVREPHGGRERRYLLPAGDESSPGARPLQHFASGDAASLGAPVADALAGDTEEADWGAAADAAGAS